MRPANTDRITAVKHCRVESAQRAKLRRRPQWQVEPRDPDVPVAVAERVISGTIEIVAIRIQPVVAFIMSDEQGPDAKILTSPLGG